MYDMAENNSFHFQENSFKLQNYTKKLLWQVFTLRLLNWISFLLSNLIWQDTISPYLLLRVNQENWLLFEKLIGNYSLKRKKQPVRVIREKRCMLKEAATTRSSRSQISFKIDVLKKFAILTANHSSWSLFNTKLPA